jgi:hypothetical protein
MATTGKSKRPPPLRDTRIDSAAPVPREEEAGRPTARPTRSAGDDRLAHDSTRSAGGGALLSDLERLKAERAADADDMGAMLVRVAETNRARQMAEKRAQGLESWTQELEAKLAEARARGDDLEAANVEMRKELDDVRVAHADGKGDRRHVAALEEELSGLRREHEDALEVERVKVGLERDAFEEKTRLAQMHLRASHAAELASFRESLAQAAKTLLELETGEAEVSLQRIQTLSRARQALVSGLAKVEPASPAERVTSPPPAIDTLRTKRGASTVPPSKASRKRSKAPPPPVPSLVFQTPAVVKAVEVVTFEDLDLGDD